MPSASKFVRLIQMLEDFIEAKAQTRGTIEVGAIEGEFARLGLDDEEEFSDLQHALAIYRGLEEDVHMLKSEAAYAIRLLKAR